MKMDARLKLILFVARLLQKHRNVPISSLLRASKMYVNLSHAWFLNDVEAQGWMEMIQPSRSSHGLVGAYIITDGYDCP